MSRGVAMSKDGKVYVLESGSGKVCVFYNGSCTMCESGEDVGKLCLASRSFIQPSSARGHWRLAE